MRLKVLLSGLGLVLAGLFVFGYKVWGLHLPLFPTKPKGLWRIEVEVTARGQEKGTIRVALPVSRAQQMIFDETTSSDRLGFSIRNEDGQRTGIWTGTLTGLHRLVYSFHVQLEGEKFALPEAPYPVSSETKQKKYLEPSLVIPSDSDQVKSLLAELQLPLEDDPSGRYRLLYGFVTREIETSESATDDAALVMHNREGSQVGKARVLVALLRAAGIPARPVVGLQLRADRPPLEITFAEAHVGGKWIPASPSMGFFAERPDDVLYLGAGDELVRTTSVEAWERRFHALEESISRSQLAEMMVPSNSTFAALSLYRLPGRTQESLRMLLCLPVGALVLSVFRNILGVPTYGTFLPVLIAMALGHTGLPLGLALLSIVLAIGISTRQVMEKLHLLVVPRLSIILSFVVLTITGAAVVADRFEIRDLFGSVLYPLVIISTLIERVTLTIEEEGYRNALTRAAWTTATSLAIYPVFRSPMLAHLMFGFPELVFTVVGFLIMVGGYTGYRLLEAMRFGKLAGAILSRRGPA